MIALINIIKIVLLVNTIICLNLIIKLKLSSIGSVSKFVQYACHSSSLRTILSISPLIPASK